LLFLLSFSFFLSIACVGWLQGGPFIADALVQGMGLGLVFFVGLAMPFTIGKTLADALFGILGIDIARSVVVAFQVWQA
jgi:hypothetical protein